MQKLKVLASLVREWLQGKKSILGGSLVVAAGVVGVAFGKLPVDQAVIVVGFGFSICGLAAKANRHQAELLSVLVDVGQLGVAVRSGNKAAEAGAVEDIAKQGIAAATEAAAK